MNVVAESFFEYERGERDICDALLPDRYEGKDRDRLIRFLKRSNLDECLSISPKVVYPLSWVGIIRYGKKQIEILPKLLNKNTTSKEVFDEGVERQNILKNLIFMLSYTRKLEIKAIDNAALSHSVNPFLEILIREYAVSLFDALKRQAPRVYVRGEDNLNYVRGKIQITANIRYNSCNQTKFYCEYDEFSEDNLLNRLFYWVAAVLSSVSQDSKNRQILSHIKNYYADIRLQPVTWEQAGKVVLSRSQQIFAKSLRLAQMFLEHSSIDLLNHKINSIALLWDMNVLFEEFVYELLRRNLPDDYIVEYQKGKRLLREGGSGRKKKNTFVDIYVRRKNCDAKVIVDTKYKKFAGWDDISNGDVYQVSTYCLLHGAKNAVLIYPKWSDGNIPDVGTLNVAKGIEEHKLYFRTVDLRDDYGKWELKDIAHYLVGGVFVIG